MALLIFHHFGIYQKYMAIRTRMQTAKLFWSGRSQAVRLPKDFRFRGDKVRIRRHGSGVILEPVPDDWEWLDNLPGKFDEDVIEAANEQPGQQERPALDKLFR